MLRLIQFLTFFVFILTCESVRLSGRAVPTNYVLNLRLEEDFVVTNEFSGSVTIQLDIENVTSFEFHSKDLEILDLKLNKTGGNLEITYSEKSDPETDFITVTSKSPFEAGDDYELQISYKGKLSDSTMVGFYKSTYSDRTGVETILAATQFEEIHARKAFPCFDEPEMKAVFTVSITYPKEYQAFSNSKVSSVKEDPTNSNLSTTVFRPTPKLSTYLIAFVVSKTEDFKCKSANRTVYGKITPEVCSRFGYSYSDTTARTSVDSVSDLFDILSDFVGYNFTSTLMTRLSLVAIPDFLPGAMENYGLITFRESYLLWDEEESSNYDKQTVITTIAHELSHQWFGDLVTLKWWSDLFLNEGFATFFQYYAVALHETDWELEKQFVVEKLQPALVTDSLDTALALSYDVENADYGTRLNDMSYNKGGSILRMIYHFLGDVNFKNGLKDYLKANEFRLVTPEDLWNSLDTYAQELTGSEALPANMTTLMQNWIKKTGYPVLTVSTSGDDLIIIQEPFVLNGSAEAKEWYVPITYTVSGNSVDFEDTNTKAWLIPGQKLTIPNVAKDADWVILNNQQVGTLDNFIKTPKIRQLLTGYYRKIGNEDIRQALANYILDLAHNLTSSVLIENEKDEDQIFTLKQVLTLDWACRLGDEYCIEQTKQIFADHKNGKSISRNLKKVVYCSALRNSDSITEDYRFLWLKYSNTKLATEKVTILAALGCTNNAQIRRHYLETALDKKVRKHDAASVFASAYSNHPEGVMEMLNFIYDYHEVIVSYFGSSSTLISILNSVSEYIVTKEQQEKFEKISKLEGLDDSVKTATNAALARVETNLAETEKIESYFREYFDVKDTKGSASHIANLFILTLGSSFFVLRVF